MPDFESKVVGATYGQAIGDAMGAPVEGWPPERIAERFADVDWETFLPVTHRGDPAGGKGDGRITDDTLMVEALMRAYQAWGAHMDAYAFERYMIPEMAQTEVWVPEYQREMPILERLFWPEKYPWIRLVINQAEPRSAGAGNRVNCGVAMYMMPVGAVNAGDPVGAYQEAAGLGLAHNESFGLEAGAVMAASFAAAFGAEAGIEHVLAAAAELAQDGTGPAIQAALQVVDREADIADFVRDVRAAIAPFDPRTGHVSDDAPLREKGVSDMGRPSRLHAIEELPVALAVLKYGGGDFHKTLQAGVRYGRDCDSIAGMACGLWGALWGVEAIPKKWRQDSDKANRRNYGQLAGAFAQVARTILARDQWRMRAREQALSQGKG